MINLSFQYILKPVGALCNNICTYCVYPANRNRQVVKSQKMEFLLAKKIINDICEDEQKRGCNTSELIWHGGEPLLAGIDFYEKLFNHQKRLPISFKNSFQTNGELITQEWCDLFKKYECSVGLSMDGPPEIHDQQRKGRNNSATSSKVLNAMNLCKQNGIEFGVLCVITNISSKYPETISNFFLSKEINKFDFLACYYDDEKDTRVSPGNVRPYEFAEFMKRVFDWYLEKDDTSIDIRIITDVMARLFGRGASLCSMQGTACGKFLTIFPDGRVYFCDDYTWGKFGELGNILDCSISQIIDGDRFKQMRRFAKNRLKKCRRCEVVAVCNGGCPRHWNVDESYFCSYYKEFYYYCYEKLLHIMQNVNN